MGEDTGNQHWLETYTRLSETELGIHAARPVYLGAIATIHEAEAQGQGEEQIQVLVEEMLVAKAALSELRHQRTRLRQSLGLNRHGEKVPMPPSRKLA